jgi:GNAT superfamily N-acetyltransferase
VSVVLLADYPHLVAAAGELRWREWGRPPEPVEQQWWVDVTAHEAGREALPITWVALDAQGQVLGMVGLGQFDVEERRDRSPWVLGLVADACQRGQGIGARLMATLAAWAREQRYSRAWVATSGLAVAFYQKCGWALVERFSRPSGEAMTILEKTL